MFLDGVGIGGVVGEGGGFDFLFYDFFVEGVGVFVVDVVEVGVGLDGVGVVENLMDENFGVSGEWVFVIGGNLSGDDFVVECVVVLYLWVVKL